MTAFDTYDLKSEINTIMYKSGELGTPIFPEESKSRKSILKTPSNSFIENESLSNLVPRPHTLEEFVKKDKLTENNLEHTFIFSELDEDEEIWVMDIPGSIDPMQLKGQVLKLDDKSKFKVGEDRYSAINRGSKSSLTCVFNTDDKSRVYKTANIKPTRTISVRRKISGKSKKKLQELERFKGVPYPNVKVRHPFFGIQVDETLVKSEKKC